MTVSPVRRVANAVWNGPFFIGPLTRRVSTGDALMKLLETGWRIFVVVMLAVAALVAALCVAALQKSAFAPATLESQIFGFATTTAPDCPKNSPFLVRLSNRSNVTVGEIKFHVAMRQAERSTDLSPVLDEWTSDYVVPAGKEVDLCYTAPKLQDREATGPFDYNVEVTSATEFHP